MRRLIDNIKCILGNHEWVTTILTRDSAVIKKWKACVRCGIHKDLIK